MNNILQELDKYKINEPEIQTGRKHIFPEPKKRNNFRKDVKDYVLYKQRDGNGNIRCNVTNFILDNSFLKNYDHVDNNNSNNNIRNAQLITSEINFLKEFNKEKYEDIVKNTAKYALQKVHDMFYNNDNIPSEIIDNMMNAYYKSISILNQSQ